MSQLVRLGFLNSSPIDELHLFQYLSMTVDHHCQERCQRTGKDIGYLDWCRRCLQAYCYYHCSETSFGHSEMRYLSLFDETRVIKKMRKKRCAGSKMSSGLDW